MTAKAFDLALGAIVLMPLALTLSYVIRDAIRGDTR